MQIRDLGRNVPYDAALLLQQEAVAALLHGTGPEVLFLLEHAPVYTIGRRPDQSSLRDPQALPHPVVVTNRGGQATYHGPGQLVGYPVLDLRRRGRDLHAHLRWIEATLIALAARFGVHATRHDGRTGIWVADRKLASIGVGVRHWISMHGFALNVTPESLPPFRAITPCGLAGVSMTCLAHEAGRPLTVAEVIAEW
jgi:lipoyl(octanoyl) transferase